MKNQLSDALFSAVKGRFQPPRYFFCPDGADLSGFDRFSQKKTGLNRRKIEEQS